MHKPNSIFEAAHAVIESQQSWDSLRPQVQETLLKLYKSHSPKTVTKDELNAIGAIFKYGLEFSKYASDITKLQGYK
jgi:hypothetical protein